MPLSTPEDLQEVQDYFDGQKAGIEFEETTIAALDKALLGGATINQIVTSLEIIKFQLIQGIVKDLKKRSGDLEIHN